MNAGSRPARGVISSEEPTCWTSGGLMPSLEEHRSHRLIALPWMAHPCPSGLTTSSLVGQLDSAAHGVSWRSGRPPNDCLSVTSLLMRETAVGRPRPLGRKHRRAALQPTPVFPTRAAAMWPSPDGHIDPLAGS